mgnify:CR=1 FL=1
MNAYLLDVLLRFGHIVFGVAWIGLLYYFNFVQTEYVKVADDGAKSDVMQKLAPIALWWFRWAAMFTFLTGLILLGWIMSQQRFSLGITLGALMGTLMMLNVWLIIWPNQRIVIGLDEGDKAAAAPKAGLASRTNTLFSLPMLYFMVASIHEREVRFCRRMAASADTSTNRTPCCVSRCTLRMSCMSTTTSGEML